MDLKKTIKDGDQKQREIAERLHVSEATLSKWINRRADVPARMIKPLADALGVSVEDVLPLAGSPPDAPTPKQAATEAAA